MIKKIIVFGDYCGKGLEDFDKVDYLFFKSAAVLRISYFLRKQGFEVKQIHHCTSFDHNELNQIIENFSQGQKVAVCVSSSFLAGAVRSAVGENSANKNVDGEFWGKPAFSFLLNLGLITQQKKFPVFFGGFEIIKNIFQSNMLRKFWGIDVLDKFVSYYVEGNDANVIAEYCKGIEPKYELIKGSKLITTSEIFDFTDCASTVLPEDNILEKECLITEIAAGCIFSCSFCNYAALGKKKNEYVRTYESLKKEIISNYENFGTTLYMLSDNILNDHTEKLKYLIRIREETKINLRWIGYARLDIIQTQEHAKLIKDSGAAAIIFGIESMTKSVGPTIGKMTDKDRIINCLKLFREVVGDEVVVSASLISGAPTETIDSIMATKDWLLGKEGQNYVDHFRFIPFVIKQGLDDRNEINRSRNNPFKDYKFNLRSDEIKGTNWISPWGKFQDFYDFAIEANTKAIIEKNGLFFLPVIYNLSNYSIETIIKKIRNKEKLFDASLYSKVNGNHIRNYKKLALMNCR